MPGKPDPPDVFSVICYAESAEVAWKSSFNGGDVQNFTAIAFKDGQYQTSRSSSITDKGENKEHVISINGLQPSVTYIFKVSAMNSHGETLSNTGPTCRTKEKAGASLAAIAGGTAAGGVSMAVLVIVLVIVLRRYRGLEKPAAKSQRLKHDVADDDSSNDDGLKDNVLYVPAGPRDNGDLGNSDTAEYAEVNKKGYGSDTNANVYAEVKKKEDARPIYADVKPKKGLFKKGEKTKQKKGKKQKSDKIGQD
ncbi:uncharacterized protein LOC134251120, partial [Saccostrea cucullata]|uniref:uncharacterized protein LOC134251120 n=1 Tax=Saccostrea cuccullata TaxID=36930 RepID=UPI002ED5F0C2